MNHMHIILMYALQGRMATWCQGRLEVCRHAAEVWQELVVDVFLSGLFFTVSYAFGPHLAAVLCQLLNSSLAVVLGWCGCDYLFYRYALSLSVQTCHFNAC